MSTSTENPSFDVNEIDEKIEKEGEFIINNEKEEKKTIFKFIKNFSKEDMEKKDKNSSYPKYFCEISAKNFKYIGILTNELKRDIYGYSLLDNQDEFLGEYKNQIREGFGIYKFKPNEERHEIYIGDYNNNKKEGKGIFIKINKIIKDDSNGNLVLIDFDSNIGTFKDNLFEKGIIYSLKDKAERLYYGKLNDLGEQEDTEALLIEDKNKIFKGKISKGNLIEGRNIFINDKYEKIKAYYFTKNKDNFYEFESEKKGENDEKLIKEAKEFEETNYEKIIQNIYNEINKGFEKMKIYENAIQVDFKNDIMYNINNNLNIII